MLRSYRKSYIRSGLIKWFVFNNCLTCKASWIRLIHVIKYVVAYFGSKHFSLFSQRDFLCHFSLFFSCVETNTILWEKYPIPFCKKNFSTSLCDVIYDLSLSFDFSDFSFWPLACTPFCMCEEWHDIIHRCPNCKTILGVKKGAMWCKAKKWRG